MSDADRDLIRKLAQLVDKLIEEGRWEGSLFLEASGKKLRELRDQLTEGLDLDATQKEKILGDANESKIKSLEVYIALYQADGLNIKKWSALLSSLGGFTISRPIYKKEEDIIKTIRSKENKQNDGYAVIRVLEEDLLILNPNTPPPMDRYDHELVMLKEGAMKSSHVVRFVHSTGQYIFIEGALIQQNGENPF